MPGAHVRPPSTRRPQRRLAALAALVAVVALAPAVARGQGSSAGPPSPLGAVGALLSPGGPSTQPPAQPAQPAKPASGYSKVLLLVEENETYGGIVGDRDAPYLNTLAARYGLATKVDAGYPARCPSLAAYILLTSGDHRGICDDKDPSKHRIAGPSVFSQVSDAGQEWRLYAESMRGTCAQRNQGSYAVRHNPAAYYADLRAQCARWNVAFDGLGSGDLHDRLAAGTLPALTTVIPNLCHDMHGTAGCRDAEVRAGDDWLRTFLPGVLAGPDYTSGRLAVVITWDEGTRKDNHIPTLVISPTTDHVRVDTPTTLCGVLRLISEVLAVDPLGCAAQAVRLAPEFGLEPTA
jgi:hypothetical protein